MWGREGAHNSLRGVHADGTRGFPVTPRPSSPGVNSPDDVPRGLQHTGLRVLEINLRAVRSKGPLPFSVAGSKVMNAHSIPSTQQTSLLAEPVRGSRTAPKRQESGGSLTGSGLLPGWLWRLSPPRS